MKAINKYNIEEWIFDALEGNLEKQELRQFHNFLDSNPSFKEDYTNWEQTYLEETEMEYPGMASLLKREPSFIIAYWKWFFIAVIAFCIAYFSIKTHGSFSGHENTKVNYDLEKLDNPAAPNIKQPERKNLQPEVIADKPINNLISQNVDQGKKQDPIITSIDNAHKEIGPPAPQVKEHKDGLNYRKDPSMHKTAIGNDLNNPIDNTPMEITNEPIPAMHDQSIDGIDMSLNEQEPIADSAILPDGTPGPDSGITMVMENTIENEGAIESKENVCSSPFQIRIGLNGGTGSHIMRKEGKGIDYLNTLETKNSAPWDLGIELFYKNLSISTGIGYLQREDEYEVVHTNTTIIDSSYWDYTMMLDSNLQIWFPIDSNWVELVDTVKSNYVGAYTTLSSFATVPIMFGYRFHSRNFEVILKTGMVFNFLTGSKGTYHVNSDDPIHITSVESSPFIKVFPQVNLSMDILYQFNRNWFLSYTPSYLIGTKNIFHPERSQNKMKVNLIKHTIGVRYSF